MIDWQELIAWIHSPEVQAAVDRYTEDEEPLEQEQAEMEI
jgi:hypothetical protein